MKCLMRLIFQLGGGGVIFHVLRHRCAVRFYLKLRESDKCSRCYRKLVD